LQLSRNLDVQYNGPVLWNQLLEAMATETADTELTGAVEIDARGSAIK